MNKAITKGARRMLYIGLAATALIAGSCSSSDFVSQSGLSSANFRMEIDNAHTQLCRLKNDNGIEVCITNYGGRIVSIVVPDRNGKMEDIVCGFDNISDYKEHRQNFGAVVGRYIGRILGARFSIDGTEYKLKTNGSEHCSHGGYPGFADRVWSIKSSDNQSVTLSYHSPDGENGFPGNLLLTVTYQLTDSNELSATYEAETDKATVLNPSNHSFFNLSGNLSHSIAGEMLWVDADSIAEYDADKCVTGRFLAVANTPFDFRHTGRIGEKIDEENAQLAVTKGYDHTWKINRQGAGLHRAALITDQASGRTMEVFTTEPGIHIYTANGHKGNITGKQEAVYTHRNSICFETMHFADSPNKPQFPSTLLRPGEKFSSQTIFRFGVEE